MAVKIVCVQTGLIAILWLTELDPHVNIDQQVKQKIFI
jgi:hypothetical protein